MTDGIESALARAREAAGELDVAVAGGASTAQQAPAVKGLDMMILDIAPVVLGSGEALFSGVEGVRFTPVEVATSTLATHVRYNVTYG